MRNKPFLVLSLLIICVTILGFPLDMMPPDAALYGSIAKEMHLNNDFINLYSLGEDWLDKPHLPFWLTAISFKIFGVSNFAYKLPGVLIFFLGVWATYKFTKKSYNKETALIAAIILATSLHSVISNFDVRAEPYLTGFIMASLYWFYKYIQQKRWQDLLVASLFCAFAIMTKGIFAMIPLVAALGGHFIITKQWKEILNPMWLVALVFIIIFIIPELYTLYVQFDMHPEKIVFGKTEVSGIKFFLWDSQFGRFFNTGPIKGHGDPFFFVHTILWAFLPWSILFYIATFLKVKRNIKIVNKNEEFYTLFGTLATVLVFSLSKFQLAHYTNIVFPFMAIITADFIVKLKNKYQHLVKTYTITQYFLITISVLAIIALSIVMKPEFNYWILLILLLCGSAIYLVFKTKQEKIKRILYLSAISFCFLYGFMLSHFYPTLFKYQGGVHAAKYINKNDFKDINLLKNNSYNFGFEFYCNKPINRISIEDLSNSQNKMNMNFFATKKDLTLFSEKNISFSIIKEFDYYRITKLKGKFLSPKTREKTLSKKYLIKLN
ncbi:ArnT family glycosyltransferase [Tenacibaculum sp. MEBiC06402]|uniref:ArnT family glycosyltransferase n=1 Tax=unclassified Tenacibaculum TaxID=2635139 RepID=UPI003B9A5884